MKGEFLPHHKSCKKRLKTSTKDRVLNNAFKTRLRKAIKDAQTLLAEGKEIDLAATYAEIDRAQGKGLIHRNKAARIKSRLAKAATSKKEGSS
jgi:small subunit ribosomal protein S20